MKKLMVLVMVMLMSVTAAFAGAGNDYIQIANITDTVVVATVEWTTREGRNASQKQAERNGNYFTEEVNGTTKYYIVTKEHQHSVTVRIEPNSGYRGELFEVDLGVDIPYVDIDSIKFTTDEDVMILLTKPELSRMDYGDDLSVLILPGNTNRSKILWNNILKEF